MSTIQPPQQPTASHSGTAESIPLAADRQRFFRRKYLLDQLLASLLLVLTSPLTLLLGLLVRLTSPGPSFYKQERLGLDGKTFQMIKLRSMVVDAEKEGKPVWCVKGDLRITPLGKVLRKLHLDELPQLLNVARGEMSLVGPRPERPRICESLAKDIDGYYQRLSVKPGITGLAQVNLPPDESLEDVRRKQALDLCYIEQANFGLELRILLATAMRVFGVRDTVILRLMRLCRRCLLIEQGLFSEIANACPCRRVCGPRTAMSLVRFPDTELVSCDSGRIDSALLPQAQAHSGPRRPR